MDINEVNTILEELDSRIRRECVGKFYSDYYVGITNDVQRRVFTEHRVDNECHWYRKCSSKQIAETIEQKFLDKGMMGSYGGGNTDSVYIYVYRITPSTMEARILSDSNIILEQRKQPTVQLYSSTHLFGYRFWKIRFIGKEQYPDWFLDDKFEIAKATSEKYAAEKKAVFEEKTSVGAITQKI